MRLCAFSPAPPLTFAWECFTFPPASLLCDGWLQLSTNNHSRSIWLHSFCLGWWNKIVLWKWSCFMRASLFVLGLFVVWCSHEKRIFTEQINFIEFLQGPHGQPFKWLQPLQLLPQRDHSEKPACVFVFIISMFMCIFFGVVTVKCQKVIYMALPDDFFESMLCCQSKEMSHWPFVWGLLKSGAATVLRKTLFRQWWGPRGAWLCWRSEREFN